MDRIIEIKVSGNHLTKDNRCAGVRGECNATKLRISFDWGWHDYAKKVTFIDARGQNPVDVVLGVNMLEAGETNVYLVPIPAEPMAVAGMLTFIIEGVLDNKVQKSFTDRLEVKDAPNTDDATNAVDPTPSDLEQMQSELEYIKGNIHEAVESREAIENMSVSAETLKTGEEAFVRKTEENGVVNLHYGLPAGERGATGYSGVYIGSSEPTDPDVNVWIDPYGGGDFIGDLHGVGSLMISVKAFGAVGDGYTDDTNALRAAAACGEAVFFPAGTYLLLGQIDMTADINWCGEGEKSVIQLMPYDRSRTEEYAGNTVANCYMINHPNAERYSISLQGLVFDANKQAYADDIYNNGSSFNDHVTCLDLHNPKSVYLDNVEVRNALIEGCYIYAQDGGSISISNCRFHDNGEYCVDASGLHIEGDCSRTFITNCEFNNNGYHGLLLGGTYGASVSNISCCYNGYGGVALWGGASKNTLSGVYCCGNYYGLILKAQYDSHIADNDVGNWATAYASGNNISGLTTMANTYGVSFCNCDKTIISGWNCQQDAYAYYIGYRSDADKDITGTVFAFFDYTEGKEHHDIPSIDKFKIQFIGGVT